MRTREEKMAS